MKNKFILEEVNRIHEIMGTSPKKIIKEGVDELVPFVARFIKKLIDEAPDIADNLFTSVTQKSTQFADDLTNAGITNMEQLLAKGTDDMIFDFFMNMNSLRLLDDVVVDTLLAMGKSGDAFVGPLINDIDKIIAAGAPDAIDSAKASVKAAGFSDNVVNQLFNRAPVYAQKIIQMTPELTKSLTEVMEEVLKKIANSTSFKKLPTELQERITLNYSSMTNDAIKRIFGQNPSPSSIQAAIFKEIDDLALQAKKLTNVGWGEQIAAQLTQLKTAWKPIGDSISFGKVMKYGGGIIGLLVIGRLLSYFEDDNPAGEAGSDTGEAAGQTLKGIIDGLKKGSGEDDTQDESQNQNQNQNQNQQSKPKFNIDDF